MRAEAYDAYDAYDSDAYDAYDAYSEKWRRSPAVRTRPANYTANAGAASKPTEFVTRSELQLALAPVARDIAAQGEAVASLGKRVETALTKIDKDTTAARRDMGAARRGVQSAQMMALLPMLLTGNSAPPQLVESRTGLTIAWQGSDGRITDMPSLANASTIPAGRPIIVGDDNKPVKVVTDVEYGALAQQNGNNNMMLVLLLMMMMGGFGGTAEGGKEGGDNNMMMMMLLLVMMMRPQTTTTPTTQALS